jgi:hypothetical protein
VVTSGQVSVLRGEAQTTFSEAFPIVPGNDDDWFDMTSSELSLPSLTGPAAYVERWSRRIPFPETVFESVQPFIQEQDEEPNGYDVAVDEK